MNVEEQLVGGALLHGATVLAVDVGWQDFHSVPLGVTWRVMGEMLDRGDPLDAVTVGDELAKKNLKSWGYAELGALLTHALSDENWDEYARRIREQSCIRRVRVACSELAEGLGKTYGLHEGLQRLGNVMERATGTDRIGRSFDYHELLALADTLEDEEHSDVLTGIPLIDHSGGLPAGVLTVVAGGTGTGKSTFALHLALECQRRGVTALICSYEDNERVFAQRAKMRSLVGDLPANPEAPMVMSPFAAGEVPELVRHIRARRRTHGIGLAMVDYMQIVGSTGGRESRHELTDRNLRALQQLAMELHIPIVVFSQLNREYARREDKRPQLSDLRDSGSLEQIGKLVIALHCPRRFDDEQDPDLLECLVLKNFRGQAPARDDLRFIGHQFKIEHWPTTPF